MEQLCTLRERTNQQALLQRFVAQLRYPYGKEQLSWKGWEGETTGQSEAGFGTHSILSFNFLTLQRFFIKLF